MALKIEIKEITINKHFKTGFSQQESVHTISIGVAIQCTKQIDELKIPIMSALLILVELNIFNFFESIDNT